MFSTGYMKGRCPPQDISTGYGHPQEVLHRIYHVVHRIYECSPQLFSTARMFSTGYTSTGHPHRIYGVLHRIYFISCGKHCAHEIYPVENNLYPVGNMPYILWRTPNRYPVGDILWRTSNLYPVEDMNVVHRTYDMFSTGYIRSSTGYPPQDKNISCGEHAVYPVEYILWYALYILWISCIYPVEDILWSTVIYPVDDILWMISCG